MLLRCNGDVHLRQETESVSKIKSTESHKGLREKTKREGENIKTLCPSCFKMISLGIFEPMDSIPNLRCKDE
jgi:hypothetical protein